MPRRRYSIVKALSIGILTLTVCGSALVVPSAATAAGHHYYPGTESKNDPVYPGFGNGGYDVTHYAITIGYQPSATRLTGDDVITAKTTQNLSRFSLDLRGLTVSSVMVDGKAAKFSRGHDKLIITPAHGILRATTFTTHVVYAGVAENYYDPVLGDEGFLSYGSGEAIAQGEPQSAASWYPVNDYPTDKATYDITATAPSNLSVLSNGILASKKTSSGKTTWHWVESSPMASYLSMVAIGHYRVVTETHKGLPVVLAVDSSLPKWIDAELAQTPAIIDFLSTQFGPYPFNAEGGIVQTDPFVRYALENQTRPVYSSAFFINQPSSYSISIIAHELAHQWYGDSVSLSDWSQIWLNEGFATYAQWLWTQHTSGYTPKQTFDDLYYQRYGEVFPTDPPAIRTPADEWNNSPYDRGAATLEALRITIGDTAFFKIIRSWAAAHAHGNGTTDQFIALAEKDSGQNLGSFFHAWLDVAGRPAYPIRK